MLIDNLSDINSPADLFTYIANVEQELESVKKHREELLRTLDSLNSELFITKSKLDDTQHLLEFYQSKLSNKKEV
jgi:peptidoglycan hydrolase CwlO-like protein